MGKNYQNVALNNEPDIESPLDFALVDRDRATLGMVQEALDQRNVLLAFQPIMSSQRPDKPAFYEGLIRILDHTGRIIPARDFIETVETQELGRRIDVAALELGLKSLIQHPALRLAINMSARSIGYPAWLRTLKQGLRADPTIAERLILEITESSAMLMPDLVGVFMEDLQARGISFALDDFGAGNTAFRYLKDFYFDIVKIDGQFIRGIATSPDNQVLTAALISIARHFEMFTVAESVETIEDATCLVGLGIDCLQGYLYGAPTTMPPWKLAAQRKRA